MLFTKLFSSLLLSSLTMSVLAAQLPELKTKQALDNIRLISNEGKFTYYQQRSGHLNMSTNYSNKLIMKNPKGTSYLLSSTDERKKIVIEVIKDYHKNLDFFSLNEIFTVPFGKTTPQKIAKGKSASLHVKDNFLTYYHPRAKKIFIQNLMTKSQPVELRLKNEVNPYFIPKVLMATSDSVFYTDINSKGHMGLQMYNMSDKVFVTVYKSKFSGMRLDFCRIKDDLYVGEFSYDGVNQGSTIVKIPLFNNKDFSNFTTLYQSEMPDIGNLTCSDNSIFFIKTLKYNSKINARHSEVVEMNITTQKLMTLTDLKYVTNIIKMDQMILIPFRHHYYVAKGQNLLNEDALQKTKDSRP